MGCLSLKLNCLLLQTYISNANLNYCKILTVTQLHLTRSFSDFLITEYNAKPRVTFFPNILQGIRGFGKLAEANHFLSNKQL